MAQALGETGHWHEHPSWNQFPAFTVRWRAARQEKPLMQWQTPTATDFRFGFEITMYVSNR